MTSERLFNSFIPPPQNIFWLRCWRRGSREGKQNCSGPQCWWWIECTIIKTSCDKTVAMLTNEQFNQLTNQQTWRIAIPLDEHKEAKEPFLQRPGIQIKHDCSMPVAQPGFSFGWGTTRLSFAFFLPSPILLFPHPPLFPLRTLSPSLCPAVFLCHLSPALNLGQRCELPQRVRAVSSAFCAQIAASRDTNTKTDPVMDSTFLLTGHVSYFS